MKCFFACCLSMTALSTAAVAQSSATYVCVEERSVGWEPEAGKIGQFKPSADKLIIRWNPGRWEKHLGEDVFQLPTIEVIKDGETTTRTSDECDQTYSGNFYSSRSDAQKVCEKILEIDAYESYYGEYGFSRDIGAGHKSIYYVQGRGRPRQNSYLTWGTCVRLE